MSDEMMTAADVADLLKVSVRTVIRRFQAFEAGDVEHGLPGFRVGAWPAPLRFRRSAIEDWIDRHTAQPSSSRLTLHPSSVNVDG